MENRRFAFEKKQKTKSINHTNKLAPLHDHSGQVRAGGDFRSRHQHLGDLSGIRQREPVVEPTFLPPYWCVEAVLVPRRKKTEKAHL